MTIRIGVLVRHEDESGVSGVGIVADLIEWSDGLCIAHWRSTTPSTIIFPNVKQLSTVHGHGGKTEAVFYDEIAPPQDPEGLVELLENLRTEGEENEKQKRLIEEISEEVAESLKEEVAKKAAKKAVKAVAAKVKGTNGGSNEEKKE